MIIIKNIEKLDGYTNFYDENESLIVFGSLDSIIFYYDNNSGNTMKITKDDRLLFDSIDELYNQILRVDFIESDLSLYPIVKNNQIEVHDCNNDYDESNIMYINKVNDEEYNMTFDFKDLEEPSIEVCFSYDTQKNIYTLYNKAFIRFYRNVYVKELDEELKLKK